ncbi:hypothetical protein LTS15_008607 [Exophiala xenobiotica]|nr:hypothetical protein LTS15_008607 [Exophiala xenobiotica]
MESWHALRVTVADEDKVIPPDSPLKVGQATIISQVVRQINAGLWDVTERCAINHELDIDLSEALEQGDPSSDDDDADGSDCGREHGTRAHINLDSEEESEEEGEAQGHKEQLRKPTFSLAPDYDATTMSQVRDEFMDKLRKVDVSKSDIFVDQQGRLEKYAPKVGTLDENDSVRIANFVFHDMLGATAYGRLVTLAKWWNDASDGDPALAGRARVASKDTRQPRAARNLFEGWAAAEQSMLLTNSFHRVLIGNVGRIQVLQQYDNLVTCGRRGLQGVPEALEDADVKMKGRWASHIKQYIRIFLVLRGQHQLSNRLQEDQIVAAFAERWGVGVCALMLVTFISFFKALGVRKVTGDCEDFTEGHAYAANEGHVRSLK